MNKKLIAAAFAGASAVGLLAPAPVAHAYMHCSRFTQNASMMPVFQACNRRTSRERAAAVTTVTLFSLCTR